MESAFRVLMMLAVARLSAGSCVYEDDSLVCSSQGIAEIPQDPHMHMVRTLDLSTNMISSVGKGSFLHFSSVSTLYLSYNQIVEIHVDSFSSLKELRNIDLSYNDLETIHPDTFSRNPLLQVVSLAGNPLIQVNTQFPILISSSLRSLDLSSCYLETIHPATFGKLPNLRILDVSSNDLQELSVESLSGLKELRIVEVQSNPLICNDGAERLVKWLRSLRDDIPVHRLVSCVEHRTLGRDQEQDQRSPDLQGEIWYPKRSYEAFLLSLLLFSLVLWILTLILVTPRTGFDNLNEKLSFLRRTRYLLQLLKTKSA